MNEMLFAELLESVQEGGVILRGEKEPSRKFEIEIFNVRKIRPQLGNRLLPNQFSISEYQLTQSLPDELRSSLPSIEEIERELRGLDE